MAETSDTIIRVRDISVQFGTTKVLDRLNLDVRRGEILGFVGPSGAGKSVLTRTIIGLIPKVGGSIEVFGIDLDAAIRRRGAALNGAGGCCFSRGRCFPPSACGRIPSFRCASISTSRSAC